MLGRTLFPFHTTWAEAIKSDMGSVHVENENEGGEESIKEILVQHSGQSQKLSVPFQSSCTQRARPINHVIQTYCRYIGINI